MELFTENRRKLRYYQEEATGAISKILDEGRNPLLIMATGTGKTIVFAEVIRRQIEAGTKSLVLAHRNELLDQAIEKIAWQTNIRPSKEKAQEYASRTSKIVVASVQTLQRDRLLSWPQTYFDLLTVDEAHHTVAKTYRNILDHFMMSRILGVTATPDRADEKALGKIFDEVAYEYSLMQGIKDGFLVRIIGKQVQDFDIDLSGLKIVAGDYTDKELGDVISEYIAPIAHNVKQHTEDRQTMLFMPNVASSELIADALRHIRIEAGYISGAMNADDRRETLYKFSQKQITHLASCNVLLEGFDEPCVDAIVMLRPTGSRTVYAQSIGRGTRPHPGKDHLLLVEFTYNSSRLNLVTAYELFATQGFGESVRQRAAAAAGDEVDFLKDLEEAKEKHYDVGELFSRAVLKDYSFVRFDPFGIGELAGVDLTGEFDIHYQGRKLEGGITRKQKELLGRYGIGNLDELDKAQASTLIDAFNRRNWYPMRGNISPKQESFLRRKGYDTDGMTKAQAGIIISKIIEEGVR